MSVYPNNFIANLPQRIIETRGKILSSLMPSGISGGGSDAWWDDFTEHTNEDGSTYKHWAGNRYAANATPEGFAVTTDTNTRTVTVDFTVTVTAELTGETYDNSKCGICNPATRA